MTMLSYQVGPATVSLQMLRTQGIFRRVVRDPTERYLYTRWRFNCVFVVNPKATSYASSTSPAADQRPAVTDRSIRFILSTPRGILTYQTDDGNILLQSPGAGADCDVTGGPRPEEPRIVSVNSETIIIEWAVETDVYEGERSSRNVIISNTWEQEETTDEDWFAVRETRGEALFNLAELTRQQVVPDLFRGAVMHPIPPGHKREFIRVTATNDGAGLRYSFSDREESHSLPANSPATRLEAFESSWVTLPGFDTSKTIGALGTGAGVVGDALTLQWGQAARGLVGIIQQGATQLPSYYKSIHVRAWGSAAVSRQQLSNLVMAIAQSRFDIVDLLQLPTVEASLTQDLRGKFVEFELVFRASPGPQVFLKAFALAMGKLLDTDETISGSDGVFITPDPSAVNPAPPYNGGTRGNSLLAVFAQFLQDPGLPPFAPWNATDPQALQAGTYQTPPPRPGGLVPR